MTFNRKTCCSSPLPGWARSRLHQRRWRVSQTPSWWSWRWSGHSSQTAPRSLCRSVRSKAHRRMLRTRPGSKVPRVNQWIQRRDGHVFGAIGIMPALVNMDKCKMLNLAVDVNVLKFYFIEEHGIAYVFSLFNVLIFSTLHIYMFTSLNSLKTTPMGNKVNFQILRLIRLTVFLQFKRYLRCSELKVCVHTGAPFLFWLVELFGFSRHRKQTEGLSSSRTESKLRDDKALVLHVADAHQVPALFTALFLSIGPRLNDTLEVKAVAIVGDPRGCTKPLLNWWQKEQKMDGIYWLDCVAQRRVEPNRVGCVSVLWGGDGGAPSL